MTNLKIDFWSSLVGLCRRLHELMYESCDLETAKHHLPLLANLIQQLPRDDESIIGAEAFSLYYELKGELVQAVEYRKRELELMKKLFQDIRVNNYDTATKKALLEGRDEKVFETRIAIIRALEEYREN